MDGESVQGAVSALREENNRLKEFVAETLLENRVLKKTVTAYDSSQAQNALDPG